jgi:hypothetical protein
MAWSFGRAVRSSLVTIPLVWFGVAEAQEYKGPIWGGSGGTASYDLDCGSTGVMVGLYGKVGQWVDQIGVTCQTVNPDGTLGSSYTRGPRGGSGGTGTSRRCTAGSVIGELQASTGSFIDQIRVKCFVWSASNRRPEYGGNDYLSDFGQVGVQGYWITSPIHANDAVACPSDKVGKAIRGKHGTYIDSLQFVCDAYNK